MANKLERKFKGCVYVRCVDSNTKALFKANCKLKRKTMQIVIERLMRFYIDEPTKVLIPNPPKIMWKEVLFFRCLDVDLYNEFHAACMQRDKFVYAVIEGLMRLFNSNPEVVGFHNTQRRFRREQSLKQELENE